FLLTATLLHLLHPFRVLPSKQLKRLKVSCSPAHSGPLHDAYLINYGNTTRILRELLRVCPSESKEDSLYESLHYPNHKADDALTEVIRLLS
ncbi:hypothetical protein, partial [Pantoea sp. B9002]|uniref:hypothetical protein n=1 Tax=Pantoea sp. B9002 TaxID=2726979 RepID=UPI001C430A3B